MPPSMAFALHTDLMLKSYCRRPSPVGQLAPRDRRSSPCPIAAHIRALAQNAPRRSPSPPGSTGDRPCHVFSRRSPSSGGSPFPTSVSEDRRAGRILLAPSSLIELSIVAINVLLNQWNNALLQCAAGPQLGCLRERAAAISACWRRSTSCSRSTSSTCNQWLQIRWRRWMTQPLSRPLADRRQPLPHAASRRRRRQSGPAHRRGHRAVHRRSTDRSASVCSAPSSRSCPSW